MGSLWISALLLAASGVLVRAKYDEEICTLMEKSNGQIPPPLPRNFELRGEYVNHLQNYTTYYEMHFDYSNSRAKYMYLLSSIEHHLLYDYETHQIIKWDVLHPGVDIKRDPLSHVCTATDMEDDPSEFIFGYKDEFSNRPKMYDASEVMRFGGRYLYAADGTDPVLLDNRGLVVNKYTGCIYDEDLVFTAQMNYSFTNKAVYTSGGTSVKEILGFGDGPLSVPAKVDILGSVYDDDENFLLVNITENFFWFQGEPWFTEDTFQIPPYMHCNNYKRKKDMHKLQTAFSTRLEKSKTVLDIMGKMPIPEETSFEAIYYNKENGLARRDYTPDEDQDTDVYAKFQSYSPIKTIYDFKEGVVYVTHKPTGRCYTRQINEGDFFEKSHTGSHIEMGTPEDIFRMHTEKMEYKGTAFTRDIDCDVWSGKYYDEEYNATYVIETHYAAAGWHVEADEMYEVGVPIKHTIINSELSGELADGILSFNFLKFKGTPPRLYNFDVSNCIETIPHKDFAIHLTVGDETRQLITDYIVLFLEAAQYYITEVTKVETPLRIQRMQLGYLSLRDNRTFLHFTLAGKTTHKTKIPLPHKGATLDQAAVNLQRTIDSEQFVIKFYDPTTNDLNAILALRGSLYIKTATGNLEAPPSSHRVETAEHYPSQDTTPPRIYFQDNTEDEKQEVKKGMSATGLSFLALAMLFIGIGIGIAVMYLYIRRYSESQVDDDIRLSVQFSTGKNEDAAETSITTRS